jgi:hypothetical protein
MGFGGLGDFVKQNAGDLEGDVDVWLWNRRNYYNYCAYRLARPQSVNTSVSNTGQRILVRPRLPSRALRLNDPFTQPLIPLSQFAQFPARCPQVKEQNLYNRFQLRSPAYLAARLCRASARS